MQKAFKKFLNMDDDKGGLGTFDQFIEIFNAEPTGETKKVRVFVYEESRACSDVVVENDGSAALYVLIVIPLQLYDLYEISDAQALNIREIMLGLNNFTGATQQQRVRMIFPRLPRSVLCLCHVTSATPVQTWSQCPLCT